LKVVTTGNQVTFHVVFEAFKEECRYVVTQCEEAQGKQRYKYRARVTTVSAVEKQTLLCEKFLTCVIQNVPKMSAFTSGVGSPHQNKENVNRNRPACPQTVFEMQPNNVLTA
jgi:hypothetical protein